jgi:DNA-binding NarL/FixJ family response regulator
MIQMPDLPAENIEMDDSFYIHPKVTLLEEKHWSYLQRRHHLSPREIEIARLVCQGFTNKKISSDLKVELGTIKVHLRNIYRKVHVKNKIVLLLVFINDINKLFNKPLEL